MRAKTNAVGERLSIYEKCIYSEASARLTNALLPAYSSLRITLPWSALCWLARRAPHLNPPHVFLSTGKEPLYDRAMSRRYLRSILVQSVQSVQYISFFQPLITHVFNQRLIAIFW